MNLRAGILISALWCIWSGLAHAQTDVLLQQQYPFLQTESNVIGNPGALQAFYAKLQLLEQGKIDQVRIVHIGDSHLQADYLSGETRRLLQQRFGNAGRGLVFPYRVAGTNSPDDIRSKSNVGWEAKRVVFPNQWLPIGVSGITISTENQNAYLVFSIADAATNGNLFNKVTVFSQFGSDCYDLGIGTSLPQLAERQEVSYATKKHTVKKGESLGLIASKYAVGVNDLKRWNNLRSTLIKPGQQLVVQQKQVERIAETTAPFEDDYLLNRKDSTGFCQSYAFPQLTQQFYLRNIRNNELQKKTHLYGLLLENTTSRGVLYNTIGVNGAQYVSYMQADHFARQVADLQPDLIIFSLGTNEALGRNILPDELFQVVDSVVNTLAALCPDASLLMTTQPDSYKKRKLKVPNNVVVKETLAEYANARFTGLWDLNTVMGGYGAMGVWGRAGLASPDRVHFNVPGYRLQGLLLYNALINGYELYRKN